MAARLAPVAPARPSSTQSVPLRVLVFPEYAVEKPHVVVDTVYTRLLPARGHFVTVIRPARSASTVQREARYLGPGELITYPDEPAGSAVANIFRARRKAQWLKSAVGEVSVPGVDVMLVRTTSSLRHSRHDCLAGMGFRFFQVSSPDAEFRSHASRPAGVAGYYSRMRGRIDHRIRRRVCRDSTAVLAISVEMRRYLAEEDGITADKIFSFPMGIGSAPAPVSDAVNETRRLLALPVGRTIVLQWSHRCGSISPIHARRSRESAGARAGTRLFSS